MKPGHDSSYHLPTQQNAMGETKTRTAFNGNTFVRHMVTYHMIVFLYQITLILSTVPGSILEILSRSCLPALQICPIESTQCHNTEKY